MTTAGPRPPVVLAIGGSDSGAGAGIQADIKAVAARGGYAVTAVTAVTAQNTVDIEAIHPVPAEVVRRQIACLLADFPVEATKLGMLATHDAIGVVHQFAERGALPQLVMDPVMVASVGTPLFDGESITAMRRLLPHVLVATPNLAEAALLAGLDVEAVADPDGMAHAAERILGFGATWVLVTGGHLPPGGDGAIRDLLAGPSGLEWLEGRRVDTPNTHGTGCTLAAAMAAHLAAGDEVPRAAVEATGYVRRALAAGAAWRLGGGQGPLDHFPVGPGAPEASPG